MGFSHYYDRVNESDDLVKESEVIVKESELLIKEKDDISAQPHYRTVPVVTSWWKFLLCNLLAACLGAAAVFLMAGDFVIAQPGSSSANSVATTTTLSASLTTSTASVAPVAHAQAATSSQVPVDEEILDCGGTPEEARAKGCIYDVMMQDWVPEPCYDAVLTERYLAKGNWTWYADGDGDTTISDEDMRKGEHGAAWMSSSYHKAHCVFSWLKIVRALRNGKGISQELLSYDHVLHCAHGALAEEATDVGLGVKAPTNYARCATYERWKLDFIPDKHDSSEK